MNSVEESIICEDKIRKEPEDRWLKKMGRNEIFLLAVEKEMVKKWTDSTSRNRKLTTFLRNIYDKEARLHPLTMQSLVLSKSFVLPKAIFMPPSQIVALIAEYDADITIQELKRRLVKSGKIKQQGKKMRYVENLLLTVADQKHAVHMSEILFELGRNVVANSSSSSTIGNIANHILPRMVKCHLCNFKTESRLVLETHKEIPHYIRRRYRCSYCIQFFVKFHEIRSHLLEKHNVMARNDYWNTSLECPSCAVVCTSELNLKKHRKLCCFAKTGFTMFATRNQIPNAINEMTWNSGFGSDLSLRKMGYSISGKKADQKETHLIRKRRAQRWIQEDFSADDFIRF